MSTILHRGRHTKKSLYHSLKKSLSIGAAVAITGSLVLVPQVSNPTGIANAVEKSASSTQASEPTTSADPTWTKTLTTEPSASAATETPTDIEPSEAAETTAPSEITVPTETAGPSDETQTSGSAETSETPESPESTEASQEPEVSQTPEAEAETAKPVSTDSDLAEVDTDAAELDETAGSEQGSVSIAPLRAAEGGIGRYKDVIDWAEWGPENRRIDNSSDVTWTKPTAAGENYWISTRCEISAVQDKTPAYPIGFPDFPGDGAGGSNPSGPANPLISYRPGSWSGDALDRLYNVGGTGTNNTLVNGIAVDEFSTTYPLRRYDVTVEFKFDCGAWLIQSAAEPQLKPDTNYSSFTTVPLGGLVFADAESNNWLPLDSGFNGSQREYISVTPNVASGQSASWRLLDSYRTPGCETNSVAEFVNGSSTLKFRSDDVQCATAPNASATSQGPASVMFLEGTRSATVEVRGGGQGAVALGAVLSVDFGDAPKSYGSAAALFQPTWQGGEISSAQIKNLSAMKESGQLAESTTPQSILGKKIDGELSSLDSANADGDDTNSLDDEDGVVFVDTENGRNRVYPKLIDGAYKFTQEVSCIGPGEIAAWIDWNRNGVFDSSEQSSQVPCVGGKATLVWEVPEDAVRSVEGEANSAATFMRVRITSQKAQDGSIVSIPATSLTTVSGEVEDYKIDVLLPQVIVQKLIVPLNGTIADATPAPAGWKFDAASQTSSMTVGAPTSKTTVTGDNGMVDFGLNFTPPSISGTLQILETQQTGYQIVQVGTGNAARNGTCKILRTGASVPVTNSGTAAQPGFTVTGLKNERVSCKIYNKVLAPGKLEVAKSSNPASGTTVTPGQTLTYTLTFKNTGGQPVTVDQEDVLTGVLDDASLVAGSISAQTPLTAALNGTGNRIKVTGDLAPGTTKTVTYQVKVKDPLPAAADATLGNFVVKTGDNPPPTCEPGQPCTVHPVRVTLSWNKVDLSGNKLKGSEWKLVPLNADGTPNQAGTIEVKDCVAASAAACTGTDKNPASGAFLLTGLVPGKYQLLETKAPAGYQLLEDEIDLVVNTNLAFGDIENEQVEVPLLPLTGGIGSYLFTGGALICVVFVAAALLLQRRQVRIRAFRQ